MYPVSTAAAPESLVAGFEIPARPAGAGLIFYYDPHFQYNAVKVLPGEYYVSNENMVIMTVLGSYCGMFVGQSDAWEV